MYKYIVLSVIASTALAAQHYPALLSRQTVELPCSAQGEKDCGDGCIPLTYTCCPDGAGGCDATTICWLGDNGEYGCCPIGATCEGPGGATTRPGETFTSTITEPGETSTFTEPPPEETTSSEPSPSFSLPTEEPTTSLSTPSISIPASTEETSTPTLTPSPTTVLSTTTTTPTSSIVTAAAADTYGAGAFAKAFGGLVLGALMA